LSLANRGLRIFPCKPDKAPMVAAWEETASNSPFAVGLKWDAAPDALPAIPVGAHGLVVIDCDRKPSGVNGVAAFHALCAEQRIDLSNAFVVESPSGGLHFYFSTQTPYSNSRGSLPAGIDVRGVGGYVIAAGAVLPDGRCYRHLAGSWDALPPLPDALAAFLREKHALASLGLPESHAAPPVTDRERAFAQAALADECAKLTDMREGQGRNRALNEAAYSLGTMDGWIDLSAVANALFEASIVNGYVSKDGDEAAKRTIASGLIAGRESPRPMLSLPSHIEAIDISGMIRNGIEAYKAKHSVVASAKRSVSVLQGSEIQAQPITWLWDGYLPLGKLTLLAGAGGTGKSTIAFSLAGTITNAGHWPDGTCCHVAGNVLIWSSEDDPADTIKPRLMAVDANEWRYGVINGVVEEGVRCPFDAARDMDGLREAITRIGGISLLVIDPIVSAVTGDMHKANDVRRSLQTIVDFAAEMNCAVLGITHFAKGTAGKNSAERVIGSQAFAALARMVLVAAKEEESNRRVFTRAKSNNSVDTGGFSYSIEATTLERGIIATHVVWGEALEGSSRSILDTVENEPTEDASQLGIAKQFLIKQLSNGPTPSKELLEHAREGYSVSANTLRRAQKELGVVASKAAFVGGWMWALPLANPSR
jgi:AAA domain/Bifunctional DNA primase/polymerase, N-terminal